MSIQSWPKRLAWIHWLSAAMLMALVGVGFLLSDLPRDSGIRLLLSRAHTLGGLTLMALTVTRLVMKMRTPGPSPLPLPALHRRGVNVVHGLIYATLFGIGLSGVVTAILTEWPSYIQGKTALAPLLEHVASREAHEIGVFALIALVFLHVGGVFVQQMRGADVLRRMSPFVEAKPEHEASHKGEGS